jgi:signal transduction histidine kinase
MISGAPAVPGVPNGIGSIGQMPDRARPLSSRARVAIVTAACVFAGALAVLLLALIPGSDQLPDLGWVFAVVLVLMGVGFVALGAVVWLRSPDNRTGLLMLVEGLVILVTGLQISSNPWLFIAGALTDALVISAFIHTLLAFPSGRLESRTARIVVWVVYAAAALQVPVVLFGAGSELGCDAEHPCPDNPLLIGRSSALSDVLESLQGIALVGSALVTVFLLLRRYRASGALARRGLAPVLFVGAAILLLAIAQSFLRGTAAGPAAQGVFFVAFALLPVAFLVGLSRARLLRGSTIAGLVDRLVSDPGAAGIDDALGCVLSDPTLFVAYHLDDGGGYVDRRGRAVQLPADGDAEGRVATEVAHDGRVVAALVHDDALCEEPELLRAAARTAALAIENARLEARLRARLAALRASRARIVEAGDAERRRLGRDLHDGAQQRLVSLMLELQLARERWERDPGLARGLVDQAFDNARAAVDELRDLAAGIHPAVLTQRGLDAAIESLANRSTVPVELGTPLDERLPLPVETAAYYVVAEALTNVAKYAEATHARVDVRHANGEAVVEVRDDGSGGADPAIGSGLRGLADRVGALDGRLEVESAAGQGTLVRAVIPVAG